MQGTLAARGPILDAMYAALGAAIVALVTGVFTWLGTRPKAKVDIQTSLNGMFEMMLNRLDGENIVLKQDMATLRQIAQREQSEMRQQIFVMREHIIKIEQLLAEHGIPFEPLEIFVTTVDTAAE